MELRAKPWHESVIEAELSRTKVLINASSVGRDPEETPIPAELLRPDILVMDLLYAPAETRLLREAAAAGASATMNGDVMLLHQTAAAFELWTGQEAPMDDAPRAPGRGARPAGGPRGRERGRRAPRRDRSGLSA